MPTCPYCNRYFVTGNARTELEQFIRENQHRLGRVNSIKRMICHRFGVKKFADLPLEKYEEALEYAKHEVDRLTSLWQANEVLEEALPRALERLKITDVTDELIRKLTDRFRDNFGNNFWASLAVEQATSEIFKVLDQNNVWEYAFKPLTQR